MKVKELIEALKEFNEDSEVFVPIPYKVGTTIEYDNFYSEYLISVRNLPSIGDYNALLLLSKTSTELAYLCGLNFTRNKAVSEKKKPVLTLVKNENTTEGAC